MDKIIKKIIICNQLSPCFFRIREISLSRHLSSRKACLSHSSSRDPSPSLVFESSREMAEARKDEEQRRRPNVANDDKWI